MAYPADGAGLTKNVGAGFPSTNDQDPWFSVTLILNDTGKLNVHFDYTNWHESGFGPTDRIKYFEY
ncbi:immunity protein YezG family protein, partial [Weizmannia sp. CD-2023]|nr:DUF600 family protein [Weizmannia sp. CD-2023]